LRADNIVVGARVSSAEHRSTL